MKSLDDKRRLDDKKTRHESTSSYQCLWCDYVIGFFVTWFLFFDFGLACGSFFKKNFSDFSELLMSRGLDQTSFQGFLNEQI